MSVFIIQKVLTITIQTISIFSFSFRKWVSFHSLSFSGLIFCIVIICIFNIRSQTLLCSTFKGRKIQDAFSSVENSSCQCCTKLNKTFLVFFPIFSRLAVTVRTVIDGNKLGFVKKSLIVVNLCRDNVSWQATLAPITLFSLFSVLPVRCHLWPNGTKNTVSHLKVLDMVLNQLINERSHLQYI